MGEPLAPDGAVVSAGVNLGEVLDPIAQGAPERAALVVDGTPVTYGELSDATASVANALRGMGVSDGDRVGLLDDISVLFVASVLAAARIGAAAAPMSHRLRPDELRVLHEAAGCTKVVAGGDSVGLAGEAFGHSPLVASVLLGWGGDAPPAVEVGDGDAAVVIFSSGTTGLPKAVPITHAELVPRVQLFSAGFDPDREPVTALMCVPAVHIGGLVGLLVALAAGTTTVVQRRFDAGEWLRLVEEHRVRRTFMVPAMLQRILDHPDFDTADLSSLESIAYGAAPARPELVRRAVEALPDVDFSNVFGQTETIGAVTTLLPDDHRDQAKIGSVGRPLPGIEWRIVDPETGEEVPTGEPGEFHVRQGGEWHATGDLVRVDADGYLWVEGRRSDVVNRGGEKVGPAEVEAALYEHPAVADAAVAGIPDEELGERVGAVVVATEPVDVEALTAHCRERLAPWKVPDRIVFVDEIPRTELGKVRRRDISAIIEGHLEAN